MYVYIYNGQIRIEGENDAERQLIGHAKFETPPRLIQHTPRGYTFGVPDLTDDPAAAPTARPTPAAVARES